MVKATDLSVGQVIEFVHGPITREEIKKYGKGSKDENAIHMSDDFAVKMNLKGVIAHGMLSYGTTIAALDEWLNETGKIKEIDCQMRGMVRPGDTIYSFFKVKEINGKNVTFEWEQFAKCPINIIKDGNKVASFECEEREWVGEKELKQNLVKEEELKEPFKWLKTTWEEPGFPTGDYSESIETYNDGGTLKFMYRLSLMGNASIELRE